MSNDYTERSNELVSQIFGRCTHALARATPAARRERERERESERVLCCFASLMSVPSGDFGPGAWRGKLFCLALSLARAKGD
jgi:hypothetical protein